MTPTISRTRIDGDRAGFTIIEIVFALILFTFGVLLLASTTLWVVRQTQASEVATERTVALQSTIEYLQAREYDQVQNGDTVLGNYTISWNVVEGSTSKLVTFTTQGPGLVPGAGLTQTLSNSVTETFEYRIPAR